MKKLIALLMAMVMLLAVPVMAQAEEADELPFEGEWVDFEYFQVYLPTDRVEVELTEEAEELGIYYMAQSEDESQAFTFSYTTPEAEITLEDLMDSCLENYGEDNVFTLDSQGMTFLCCIDSENDCTVFMLMDPVDLGVYLFSFAPASDDAFMVAAGFIIGTVTMAE